MRIVRFGLGSALAAAIAAAPAAAGKYPKVAQPVAFAPVAEHDADAPALVWVNKPGAAKGVRNVVIPFFQVQFVVDSDTAASVSGAASKMMVRLTGPTPEQMQAIPTGSTRASSPISKRPGSA